MLGHWGDVVLAAGQFLLLSPGQREMVEVQLPLLWQYLATAPPPVASRSVYLAGIRGIFHQQAVVRGGQFQASGPRSWAIPPCPAVPKRRLWRQGGWLETALFPAMAVNSPCP